MAGGSAQASSFGRPRPDLWVVASAAAGAIGGFAVAPVPFAGFVSAGLVGLVQGLLFRRWLAWWSWAVTTAIAGGAALALTLVVTVLKTADSGSAESIPLFATALLNGAAGTLIGGCHALLLANRYRGTVGWVLASGAGTALFWTAAMMGMATLKESESLGPFLADRIPSAALAGLSWGGLAAATAVPLQRLKERDRR